MKRAALLLALALPVVGGLAAAVVVAPTHVTRDRVVAECVLSSPGRSDEDCSARLQSALDEVGGRGGGTVFLPPGVYTVSRPITLPVGVTLRGDYSAERPAAGAVLRIVGGRGDENGAAAFTVMPGAGLQGLVFWYPEQSIAEPVPYPWTVRTALNPSVANDNQTVADCTFVNAWQGISIGPEWNELHTFRRLRICALKTGFAVDSTTDIGRVSEVTVSPSVWSSSGLPGAPSAGAVRAWLRGHGAVGADYGRSDWEFVWRLRVDGYATGVRYRKGRNGLTNAVMADCDILDCEVAMELLQLNGVGLAVYDSRLVGERLAVRFDERFDSLVQFHSCRLQGGEEVLRRAQERRMASVAPSDGRWVRPEPLDAHQPTVAADFLQVVDYGASTNLEDNTAAFQRALDAAAKRGGTVYVPAGRYRFRGGLRVPSRVELRGCCDVPHHTCSGGSMLLPLGGRGEEQGTPFLSLAESSGLRGFSVWYPEQNNILPVAYPWTVRSEGRGCWIKDVNLGNAWQGVDFAANPSDGHVISYLSGCCFRRGLWVGRCAGRGWVEDVQMNPHYSWRLPPGLARAKNPPPPAGRSEPVGGWTSGWLRANLEGLVFTDCADEQIRGTFLYAARDGITFRGRNSVQALIHGTDTGTRGLVAEQSAGSRLDCALMQLVPYASESPLERGGIVLTERDAGVSRFLASQFWVNHPTLVKRGAGEVAMDQFNSLSGPVVVHGGKAQISNGQFALGLESHVIVSNATAAVVRDNVYRHGACKVRDPGSRAVVRGCSGTWLREGLKLPSAPPVDFRLDCAAGGNAPTGGCAIAKAGGIRQVSAWSCRVVEEEGTRFLRMRGRSDDPSYSFLYCEAAAPAVPVYPDTVLEYRFRPLNSKSRVMAIDLAFDDWPPLRECGVGMHVGEVISKPGEWCHCQVKLGKVAGRTIRSVMLKYDSRSGGGDFGADFADIRIVTPNPRENWSMKAVLRDGVVTMEPKSASRVFYSLDGRNVTAASPSFTGSLRLPSGTEEFRWSPSLTDGTPSALEFVLPVSPSSSPIR